MIETNTEPTESTAPDPIVQESPVPSEPATDQSFDAESQVFSAEYVKALRDESAGNRIKAKRIDEANARLLHSVAESDGRLVNATEIKLDDALLDVDGIVDPAKVRDAIAALIVGKPYLASRKAITVIPQGVQAETVAPISLFSLVAERA